MVAGYAGTCGFKGNRAAPSCRFALRTSCPPARGASRLLPCRLCGAGWGKGPDGGTPATPGGGRALIVASPDHPTVCVGESWRGPAVPSPIPLGVLRHGVAPLLRVSMAFVLFRSGWGFRWGGRDPVRASPMPTGSQRGVPLASSGTWSEVAEVVSVFFSSPFRVLRCWGAYRGSVVVGGRFSCCRVVRWLRRTMP